MRFNQQKWRQKREYFIGQPVLVKLHNFQYQRPAKVSQILLGKQSKKIIAVYKLQLYNAQCVSFSTYNSLRPLTKQNYFQMLVFTLELPKTIQLSMQQALKSAYLDMKGFQRRKVQQLKRRQTMRSKRQTKKRTYSKDEDEQPMYTFMNNYPPKANDAPADGCVQLYRLVEQHHPWLSQKEKHSLVLSLTNTIRLETLTPGQQGHTVEPQTIKYPRQLQKEEVINTLIDSAHSNVFQEKEQQQADDKCWPISKRFRIRKQQKRFCLSVKRQGQAKTILYKPQQKRKSKSGLTLEELTEECKQIDGLTQLIQYIQIMKESRYIYTIGRPLTVEQRQFAEFALNHSTLIKRIQQGQQHIDEKVLVKAVEIVIKRLEDRLGSYQMREQPNDIYLLQVLKLVLENGVISFMALSKSKIIRSTIAFVKKMENCQENDQLWGIGQYNYLRLWYEYWKATYHIKARQSQIQGKFIDQNLKFLYQQIFFPK